VLGERDRARTGTAADIDNTLALPQLRSLQRCSQDWTLDDVLRFRRISRSGALL
jgi:hypothetical protein